MAGRSPRLVGATPRLRHVARVLFEVTAVWHCVAHARLVLAQHVVPEVEVHRHGGVLEQQGVDKPERHLLARSTHEGRWSKSDQTYRPFSDEFRKLFTNLTSMLETLALIFLENQIS